MVSQVNHLTPFGFEKQSCSLNMKTKGNTTGHARWFGNKGLPPFVKSGNNV